MQKLIINHFGPIEYCEIDIDDFLVLTGPQASGKSTVAKSIFYFNHLKDILFQYIVKQHNKMALFTIQSFKKAFLNEIRNAFVQSFGEGAGDVSSLLEYTYDNGRNIRIKFKRLEYGEMYVEPIIDDELSRMLSDVEDKITGGSISDINDIKNIVCDAFGSDMEVVYIPAGRSLLTLLSTQIGYLYSVMDDRQKRSMDYCTQNYLERVLQIKPYFDRAPGQLLSRELNKDNGIIDEATMIMVIQKMYEILKGEYKNSDGEELLRLADNELIKLNYASSGQQEAVWITNMLFYYMLGNKKTYFIIEEPESHLFPETQKSVTELISLAKNDKNKVLITTHSPYVLGSINNLLYAKKISDSADREKIEEIVPYHMWLSYESVGAYYLEDGKLKDIFDTEYQDIDHGVIDGVSSIINDDYEKLVSLKPDLEG